MELAPLPQLFGIVLGLAVCRVAEAAPSGPLVDAETRPPSDRKIIDEAVLLGASERG